MHREAESLGHPPQYSAPMMSFISRLPPSDPFVYSVGSAGAQLFLFAGKYPVVGSKEMLASPDMQALMRDHPGTLVPVFDGAEVADKVFLPGLFVLTDCLRHQFGDVLKHQLHLLPQSLNQRHASLPQQPIPAIPSLSEIAAQHGLSEPGPSAVPPGMVSLMASSSASSPLNNSPTHRLKQLAHIADSMIT